MSLGATLWWKTLTHAGLREAGFSKDQMWDAWLKINVAMDCCFSPKDTVDCLTGKNPTLLAALEKQVARIRGLRK